MTPFQERVLGVLRKHDNQDALDDWSLAREVYGDAWRTNRAGHGAMVARTRRAANTLVAMGLACGIGRFAPDSWYGIDNETMSRFYSQ